MQAYLNPKKPVSLEWNMNELDDFIHEFIHMTEYDTAAAVRYVTREVAVNAAQRTPIGETSRAIAGWSAVAKNLNFTVPSSSASRSGDSSYREHLTGSNQFIEFYNNVPYIIYLEYGWSKQAPLGMVRIAIAEVKSSGILPAILAKSYEDRWNDLGGTERYEKQASILSRGLPAVKTKVPSRRSIAAHLSAERRKRRASHRSSAVLTKIQKSFSGSK